MNPSATLFFFSIICIFHILLAWLAVSIIFHDYILLKFSSSFNEIYQQFNINSIFPIITVVPDDILLGNYKEITDPMQFLSFDFPI